MRAVFATMLVCTHVVAAQPSRGSRPTLAQAAPLDYREFTANGQTLVGTSRNGEAQIWRTRASRPRGNPSDRRAGEPPFAPGSERERERPGRYLP